MTSQGSGELVDLQQEKAIASGDQFQMQIVPRQDCYLYVLWIQSQGEPLLLHPSTGDSAQGKVKARQEVVLPERGLWYKLDNQKGDEVLYVAASYEPIASIKGLLDQMSTTRGTPDPMVGRELKSALDDLAGTRGLAGVTSGKPIKVHLPDGQTTERLTQVLMGKEGVIRKLTVKHL